MRAAVLLGCSPTEAEDVAQSTLLRCLTHWRRVERADDPDAYVHRVLGNTFTSARRRRWTGELATAELPETTTHLGAAQPPTDDDHSAVRGPVAEALARLSPTDREVLRLTTWECLTPAEVAVALDISPGAARVRLHRARQAFAADPGVRALVEAPCRPPLSALS